MPSTEEEIKPLKTRPTPLKLTKAVETIKGDFSPASTPSFLSPANSCPGTPTRGRSPIRPDSPLICGTPPMSPIARRAKELKRVRSFRTSRSSSRVRNDSECNDNITSLPKGVEVCFSIRPSLGARKGWKIMPEDGSDEITDPQILGKVVKMIKEMELNGHAIPERITIKN